MTVVATTPYIKYVYSGAGDYNFSFKVYEEEEVVIRYISLLGVITTLTYVTDYSVTLVDGTDGGVCSLTYSESDGYIEILQDIPMTQPVDWVNNNALDMGILEGSFDKAILLLQQLELTLSEVVVSASWRGDWVTTTVYYINDIIATSNGNLYIALTDHTSGTFATDLSNGNWALYVDLTAVQTLADEADASATAAAASAAAAIVTKDEALSAAAICASIEASISTCITDQTIAEHDTSATGAELDTLTDGSDADDLHVHNHLVASGSGLPVVVVSALGATSTTGKLTVVDFEAGGDITVGGTVDGRDIATDGTALDKLKLVGNTASRPGAPSAGDPYFDTTLGVPIWYDGSNWVNSIGITV